MTRSISDSDQWPTSWEGRTKTRHHTKCGNGRIPYTHTSKPAGTKLWNKCPDKRRDLSA